MSNMLPSFPAGSDASTPRISRKSAPDDLSVGRDGSAANETAEEAREPFLTALGERVKALRTRRGLTRKSLARATGVSERHLANLEYGVGNASILILVQVAQALQCSLAELVGDVTTQSPEWLLLREMLADRDEATLRRVRLAALELTGGASPPVKETAVRSSRIALIGLRGAGKSTLGRMLAEDLDFPFVELSREIEKLAGCSCAGKNANAYSRFRAIPKAKMPIAASTATKPARAIRARGARRKSPRAAGSPIAGSRSATAVKIAAASGRRFSSASPRGRSPRSRTARSRRIAS